MHGPRIAHRGGRPATLGLLLLTLVVVGNWWHVFLNSGAPHEPPMDPLFPQTLREAQRAWEAAQATALQAPARRKERERLLRNGRACAARARLLSEGSDDQACLVELQARIEHDAGNHRQELALARELPVLAPGNPVATAALLQAMRCVGEPGSRPGSRGMQARRGR